MHFCYQGFAIAAQLCQPGTLGPEIIREDYNPGFFLKHFVKDMILALEKAEQEGLSLDILRQTLKTVRNWKQRGWRLGHTSF